MAIEPEIETQEIRFSQDTNVKGIGTLTISINGILHEKRVNTNIEKDVDAFIIEIKDKVSTTEKEKADIDAIIVRVSEMLNKAVINNGKC